jgi:DNA-binding MarR family transcriptional regulator
MEILIKTFLVLNALFYAKDGMTQKEICDTVYESKQTVSLIIKKLLKDGYVTMEENTEDTAMSMFTPEEQKQLIDLSRTFVK